MLKVQKPSEDQRQDLLRERKIKENYKKRQVWIKIWRILRKSDFKIKLIKNKFKQKNL